MKISVITPSLNSVRYMEDSIISVLKQNYSNFEHIIVDGGSTDCTIDMLKKYPHLKWISEPDNGQSQAMNKGFEMSSGDIIVYLNADDYFEPGAFFKVSSFFRENRSAIFLVGKLRVIEESGNQWINNPKISFADMIRWWESQAYPYNPAAYFYKREIHEQGCKFNEDEHYFMDWEFLLDASKLCKFNKIDAILGNFRLMHGTKTFETKTTSYYTRRYNASIRFAASLGNEEKVAFMHDLDQIYKQEIKKYRNEKNT
ncbi:MAG: glycosyltransferase [Deltaproteobacteria bacterium]|nr:glycosyltransferase [Deltaproteobacteria bacterium]